MATAAALCAVLAFGPTLASATPDQPNQPQTSAEAQRQLGELALQNTQLVEAFDQAQIDVTQRQSEADAAVAAATDAEQRYEQARQALSRTVAARYEGGAFSVTGALLTSTSGDDYLHQLETLSMLSAQNAEQIRRLTEVRNTAEKSRQSAQALLADAKAKRDALAADRSAIEARIDQYRQLLGRLTAAEQAAYRQAAVPAVSPVQVSAAVNISALNSMPGAAAQAVRFALAQVGKPYVFGASGPNAYDCSGLTAAAWASAGVSLPHSAERQYGYGQHVSFDQMRPGDLMFFYQPIGHVTIYIGNGLMVSAPQSGENVSVVPAAQFGKQFVGATRLVND